MLALRAGCMLRPLQNALHQLTRYRAGKMLERAPAERWSGPQMWQISRIAGLLMPGRIMPALT